MIAAPVQCNVDGIAKGRIYVREYRRWGVEWEGQPASGVGATHVTYGDDN
jgi:hypothetical protein